MKKRIFIFLLVVISLTIAFHADGIQYFPPSPETLPSKSGHSLEFLRVTSDESSTEWMNVGSILEVSNSLVTYTGSSTSATDALELTPASYTPITIVGTGSIKFTGNFSCQTLDDFGGVTLEGFLVYGGTSGTRLIGTTIEKKWEISSGTFGVVASYSPDGILKFIASGPDNLDVGGNVTVSKVQS